TYVEQLADVAQLQGNEADFAALKRAYLAIEMPKCLRDDARLLASAALHSHLLLAAIRARRPATECHTHYDEVTRVHSPASRGSVTAMYASSLTRIGEQARARRLLQESRAARVGRFGR